MARDEGLVPTHAIVARQPPDVAIAGARLGDSPIGPGRITRAQPSYPDV